MGEHHLEEAHGMVRVAGRGAVVATAALALTGAGGGLALATDHEGDHGGDHGHDSEWDDGHEFAASEDALCETDVTPDLAGGLLSDLGLSGSTDELCADDASSPHPESGHSDSRHSDSGHSDSGHSDSGHSESTDHGGTPAGSEAQPAAEPSEEPAQDLPAPGETRVTDLPDRT